MQLLVLKINSIDINPEYALLGKKQTQGRFASEDWKRVRSLARGRKVLVLLSSDEVVLTSATIPSKNRKQLLQAIPYALEDTLADDIENLHFVVEQDSNSEDKESKVAIINRNLLAEILDLLKSKGITASFVLPELLTHKLESGAWSIAYTNNDNHISASVRLDKYKGFVCDQEMLDMFIAEPLEQQAPTSIFSNTKSENLPQALQDINASYIESGTIDYKSAVSALPLNLLTNFVRRSQQSSSVNLKAWKPVALLGGVLASIWMGIFFWQNNLLQLQSNELKAQIEQVYKDTFPKGRIVDAPIQMSSALNKLKSNVGTTIESPLPLIADLGPLLKEYKDLALNEVRYQENQLSMTIESPNLSLLEKFKNDAATTRNLKIEIKDSTTTANKVKAVILISPLPNITAEQVKKKTSLEDNS